mmetsp:Transcript_268/g.495  ORF Transcript_268/g.495 Transcript_268/m.495 type:complete len:196 (+) Transcript_268:1899-2486(+)
MSPSRAYITLYNLLQAGGWLDILYQTVRSNDALMSWNRAHLPLHLCQVTSLVDTLHAAGGLLKSSPLVPFLKTFGHLFISNVVSPFVPHSPFLRLLFLSWSLSDSIHYLYQASLNVNFPFKSLIHWLYHHLFLCSLPLSLCCEWGILLAFIRCRPSSLTFTLVCLFYTLFSMTTYFLFFRQKLRERALYASSENV